ncbi:MAG: zinc ribbon domain-containing protein [Anaerolineales bacterium]|nr:zinc ribbon domain-containing protein [Anaerolineales bacterium]
MDIGVIFLLLALLVLIALFVARPFMLRTPATQMEEAHVVSALLAERDRILNALQEIDFDYTLGKIPAEDYPVQRTNLLQRGAAILRQLDALSPLTSPVGVTGEEEGKEATDEDLEALIAKRRAGLKDKSAGFCPKCGRPILISDSFCPQCGYALK